MMKLYLIRHGRQCSRLCNVNVELSPEGYRQAALTGQRLALAGIEAVYSSDLIRAVQTAEAANLYWNADHVVKTELREISFGEMEGLSDEVIAERFADFKIEQDKMEEDLAYPGGECAGDVVRRAMPAFLEIAGSGHKCAAVVTHGGLIRCMVSALVGVPLERFRLLGSSLENCSVTELCYDEKKKRFTLERFNDYAHLEQYGELLRSGWVQAEN